MNALLDTHTLLRFPTDAPQISPLAKGFPVRLRVVAYPPAGDTRTSTHRSSVEFTRRVEVAELPGWAGRQR